MAPEGGSPQVTTFSGIRGFFNNFQLSAWQGDRVIEVECGVVGFFTRFAVSSAVPNRSMIAIGR
jgi:hypothetical protein